MSMLATFILYKDGNKVTEVVGANADALRVSDLCLLLFWLLMTMESTINSLPLWLPSPHSAIT